MLFYLEKSIFCVCTYEEMLVVRYPGLPHLVAPRYIKHQTSATKTSSPTPTRIHRHSVYSAQTKTICLTLRALMALFRVISFISGHQILYGTKGKKKKRHRHPVCMQSFCMHTHTRIVHTRWIVLVKLPRSIVVITLSRCRRRRHHMYF